MIKRTLKFAALTIGAVAFIFGSSSCKKDDDDKSCCTWTYDGEKETICEGDEEGLTGETWTLFKTYIQEYYDGATCVNLLKNREVTYGNLFFYFIL